jgi:hypothetical protein
MNIRQAQRLSTIETAFRHASDGSLYIWTAGVVPTKITAGGTICFDYTALHHHHFESDWQPLRPTPEGVRLLKSNEPTPRYDLIDSIREQIANGTYTTGAKLEAAFRRMIQEW